LNGKTDLEAWQRGVRKLVPHANDSNHLRERAAEMRASSKELKDNNTAAVILRLAELYDRLADRAEIRSNGAIQAQQVQLPRWAGLHLQVPQFRAGIR
jgi:hypothetical protein